MSNFIRISALSLSAAGLVLGLVAPASAATGGVEVSLDGASFGSSVRGTVFTDITAMVPGDAQQGTFYLRNSSNQPGFVRIVMSGVDYTDLDFANALILTTTVNGERGTSIPVSQADPCWLLTEGQVLPPGGTLAVTTTAALGMLHGTQGQGARANIDFGVSLSDMTPGSLSPDHCGVPDVTIPIVDGGAAAAPAGPGFPAQPADPQGPGSGGLVPAPGQDLPVLSPDDQASGMDPNTWRLLEEYYILVPIGAALVGGIIHWLLTRRRDDRPAGEVAA